jgi:hypothetical protein
MPYSAKTSEWNHQPLLAEEDRQRWWIARQQILAESENQTYAYQQQHQHQHPQHHHQMSSPPTAALHQPTRHHRTMSHSSTRTVDTGEPGFVSPEAMNASTPSTRGAASAAQAPYYHQHQSPAEVKSAASENQHPLSSNPSPGVNVPIHVDPEIAAEMDEEQLMKYF